MLTFPDRAVLGMLALLGAALLAGSIGRWLALRHVEPPVAAARWASLRTWWGLVVVTSLAILLGRVGVVLLFTVASGFAFHEYLRITQPALRRGLRIAVWLWGPLQYAAILSGWQGGALLLLPTAAVMTTAAVQVVFAPTSGFVSRTGSLLLGLFLTVYLPSHAVLLFIFPALAAGTPGAAGWFLFLVVLTEMNDIAQATCGRRWGRHKICPSVSPQKTWEGWLGGLLTTTVLAIGLAPWLTPLNDPVWWRTLGVAMPSPSIWAGLLGFGLGLCGFLGDITMSAVKRDAGVKDGSGLLPGQGGMIDRIDSLAFTSPFVFYMLCWLTMTPKGGGP
jgi:phosphatidate cytidylyltransferase